MLGIADVNTEVQSLDGRRQIRKLSFWRARARDSNCRGWALAQGIDLARTNG